MQDEKYLDELEVLKLSDDEMEDLETNSGDSPTVSYRGQDYDVYGLVRRLRKGTIIVPRFGEDSTGWDSEGFQRGFVWKPLQMDRFIESILLKFPIPSIFLVTQKDGKHLVLDGQQRLTTLKLFLEDGHRLGGSIAPRYAGKTFEELDEVDQRAFEDYSIQTITLNSLPNAGDLSVIYQIFERINSGGTQLTPHEIRMALYAGGIVDYIERLNNDINWRYLYGKKNPRVRDHELVSRILAFYLNWKSYTKPLKSFLNSFYVENSGTIKSETEEAAEKFIRASRLLSEIGDPRILRWTGYAVNTAWTDSIFVGLMNNIDSYDSGNSVKFVVDKLRSDPEFGQLVVGPTSDELIVSKRMSSSIQAFGE